MEHLPPSSVMERLFQLPRSRGLRGKFLPDLEQSLLEGVWRARLSINNNVAAPDVDHVAVGVYRRRP